ncbi:DUF1127 domain-containing protein [Marivita sp.]|jgi:uncharacterized protein YjiS (DUF1127 family)|uniref:DUF1127 domain-containing protein n=1 Tax=Marivita sp. TaxID=2003365 RepID=UPI003F7033CC
MTHAAHASQIAYLGEQSTLSPVAVVALRVAVTFTQWSERRRTRTQLKHLDDHLLCDIGLDRLTAQREANRKFWLM